MSSYSFCWKINIFFPCISLTHQSVCVLFFVIDSFHFPILLPQFSTDQFFVSVRKYKNKRFFFFSVEVEHSFTTVVTVYFSFCSGNEPLNSSSQFAYDDLLAGLQSVYKQTTGNNNFPKPVFLTDLSLLSYP